MNLEGHVEWCACVCVCVYVCVCVCTCTKAGLDLPMNRWWRKTLKTYVAFLLNVIRRLQLCAELCLPPHPLCYSHNTAMCYSHFTLMKYCYSGTLSGCLSDLRYFGTKHTFRTWLKCQMQLLGMIDTTTLQSVQQASPLPPALIAEMLASLCHRDETLWAEWQSVYSVCSFCLLGCDCFCHTGR